MVYSRGVARRTLTLATALAGAALVVVSCGPSVSAIYEANVRFEHCYRLDLDPKVAPGHRITCWREWSQRYTYGQTRDRLEYARQRIATLGAGDASRPELDLSAVDGGPGSTEAPVPTSAHAPPPPVLSTPGAKTDAGAPDAAVQNKPDAALAEPPGASCVEDCRQSWKACLDVCSPDAGNKRGGCKACEGNYGRCVQRCYR